MALSIVILAAGDGKRMHSFLPKVLHPLGGQPLLLHVVQAATSLSPEAIYVIYGRSANQLQEAATDLPITWVHQPEPRGTGHALMQVLPHIPESHRVLVLYGDVPLIKANTLNLLLAETKSDQLGIIVTQSKDPNGFGRIIRNQAGDIVGIVEHRDATAEQLKITEINTGILTAPCYLLKKWVSQLTDENAQGEFYLTGVVTHAVQDHISVRSISTCNKEVSGVNDRKELMVLERYYQLEIANKLLVQGVTIMDPNRFDCRGEIRAEQDVVIDVDTVFQGKVTLGEGSVIGPFCVLTNVQIGKNVIVHSHTVIEDACIDDNCIIGPFARIRPGTRLHKGVHVGNFVEIKKTEIGKESKVNHHSYLGDAIVGEDANIGAGTITCNYNGVEKFTTVIEDGVFIGSGTQLIAPVKIAKNAYIGAGSTITRDAPENQLTLARAKQVTVKGWKRSKDKD
jgi:bifunctional UDP-N-acetylglucosamine pyrophosphorylase/glucosamine-1-phosphate N-acetyltransferase